MRLNHQISFGDSFTHVIDKLRNSYEQSAHNTYNLNTGFIELDEKFGGFVNQSLNIIGGYPNSGKLDFCLQICRYMAINQNKKVVVVNLKQPDLPNRIFRSTMEEKQQSAGGCLTDAELAEYAHNKLSSIPLEILDWSYQVIDPRSLFKQLSKVVVRTSPDVLLINDIQHIVQTVDINSNLYTEVSIISRTLFRVARVYDICILALSKLNRRTRAFDDQRPRLFSLSDAGCLEDDATTVLLLHALREPKERTISRLEVNIAKCQYLAPNTRLQFRYNRLDSYIY
ncbi:MAG: DnaB helicase C-terminal domain-containing protein [Candidatus Thiodiazotropha taylori]|uniref:DnaB helicase C-terminal domain-containing protein n=1 Tax=Candidatus Thiodiazotropha taylori TaxID=2792791 RepID=A0A9E4KBZ9_9GAMM|nr:DnaB helicase C-terminal domain-containing protein [Candidatus Thiodiazotropha taylori]MCW4256336.1 DnaB helicase C-terminal domain-containing protein [Candidatus Thiodiazotropha taylori]